MLSKAVSRVNYAVGNYSVRAMSTTGGLKEAMEPLVAAKRDEVKEIKAKYGNKLLGTCTVEQAYGGMRSVKSMVTETSLLDPEEGIRYRGLTLFECQEKLPKAPGGEEPLPEAALWLLLTGEVPTQAQTDAVTADLNRRSELPAHVRNALKSVQQCHPMSQLSVAVNALQSESKFVEGYNAGMKKTEYWEYALEDSLSLIAKLPTIAAQIYVNTYRDGSECKHDTSLDWSAAYSKMMGYNDATFYDLMRLYLVIHADHEGGNVSAHTTHLVGSALSDPYLSFAAGMNGLAGPLHGLANQEVLRWLQGVQKEIGNDWTKDDLKKFVWDTLNSGKVVPGYGHAVLRKTDPRYEVQRNFALKHLPHDDPTFRLVSSLYEVTPDILMEHGKAKNPWPNVDAHSGCLLTYYGLTEQDYYTVMFGVSRALGVLPSLVWDRALGLPLERPKSVTSEWIAKQGPSLKDM